MLASFNSFVFYFTSCICEYSPFFVDVFFLRVSVYFCFLLNVCEFVLMVL
jgi:hypothetical protein